MERETEREEERFFFFDDFFFFFFYKKGSRGERKKLSRGREKKRNLFSFFPPSSPSIHPHHHHRSPQPLPENHGVRRTQPPVVPFHRFPLIKTKLALVKRDRSGVGRVRVKVRRAEVVVARGHREGVGEERGS